MTHTRGDNLPAETTSFVDRVREVSEVEALVARERLVTLTGIGGVGKSRLALRVARRLVERPALFPDGVWLVELSPLRDPKLLAHTVSAALGVRDQAARPQEEVLGAFLADKRMLVLLDTCEHLAGACAELAAAMLAAPGVRVLATSRVPLGLPVERRYTVEPLGDEEQAAALFLDRAGRELERGADVRRLCRRLDGIPLAIELAAGRLGGLTVEQLTERLDDRFRVLASGRATTPRHQTMLTTIGWSHELCLPAERLLWARLSVFAGPFGKEDARVVCAGPGLPAERVDALLSSLVDKSIVLRVGGRYRLLDTVREYGAEWLVKLDEDDDLRRRHRDRYLAKARRFDRAWCGPHQIALLGTVRADQADHRAALEFSFGRSGGQEAGLELAGLLTHYWLAGGAPTEGRLHLARALERCPEPSRARARVLWALALLALVQGEPDAAGRHIRECRATVGRIPGGDRHAAAWATAAESIMTSVLGRSAEAVPLAAAAAHMFAELGQADIGGLYVRMLHGIALVGEQRLAEARDVLDDTREQCLAVGEDWVRSHAELFAGMTRLALGDTAAASRSADAALEVKRAFGDRLGCAIAVDLLAQIATARGEGARAARLVGVADAAWRSISSERAEAAFLVGPHRECVRALRRQLGDAEFERLRDTGRAMAPDAGADYALRR